MIKQVLNQIDISWYAELSLLLFSMVFVAVVIRTLLTKSEITRQQANVVLEDHSEDRA